MLRKRDKVPLSYVAVVTLIVLSLLAYGCLLVFATGSRTDRGVGALLCAAAWILARGEDVWNHLLRRDGDLRE